MLTKDFEIMLPIKSNIDIHSIVCLPDLRKPVMCAQCNILRNNN